ncbi:hypothetical protein [Sandaracinus amylolyticus]|uniref:hypothetical protein n=1 Tax=Sandaracinus amylolyticus TaxID=927083 RepID=UPI001F35E0FF|nr:hypothetical protein [Sandaracinus amylolyticus]UJR82695.1 Hypothetical protein I5071_47600 [Sandaracinus amylolyticus]
MGLVVAAFRTEDPLALLPRLRDRTEALLGARVSLSIEPAGYHFVLDGLNVVVVEHDAELEVRTGGMSWLAGAGQRIRRVRDALGSLGGVERMGWRARRFRYAVARPSAEDVTRALGAGAVHRFPAWAVMRSGLRTPVEIQLHERALQLEAPIVILGRLYDRAVAAASELAERIPLGGV